MALLRIEIQERKKYILRRLAADDFSPLEIEELCGLLALARSPNWQNAFVSQILCDYGAGKRATPQQVLLTLADSVEAIESVARKEGEDSKFYRRLTGARKSGAPVTQVSSEMEKPGNLEKSEPPAVRK